MKNQIKTNNSIIRSDPQALSRGQWEAKHCGRDSSAQKSPQHLHRTFLKGKAKIQLHTLPPVVFCSLPFTQTSAPACVYLNSTYQSTSLPAQATPTTKKSPSSPHLLRPPWGRIGFLQLVTLFEEKWWPLSRSHKIMNYIQTTWPVLSTKNTANHIRTLRLGFEASQKSQGGVSSELRYIEMCPKHTLGKKIKSVHC